MPVELAEVHRRADEQDSIIIRNLMKFWSPSPPTPVNALADQDAKTDGELTDEQIKIALELLKITIGDRPPCQREPAFDRSKRIARVGAPLRRHPK